MLDLLFFLFLINFIHLFLAVLGPSLLCTGFLQLQRAGVTLCCGAQASHCGGFSCCRAQALDAQASTFLARGLSGHGSRALECRLSSCGTRAQLLHGMWDLPGPELEPVFPAPAGGLSTTAPPGKSHRSSWIKFFLPFLKSNPIFFHEHLCVCVCVCVYSTKFVRKYGKILFHEIHEL